MHMGVRGAFTLSVGASEAPILHSKAHSKQARDLSKSGNISFVSQIYCVQRQWMGMRYVCAWVSDAYGCVTCIYLGCRRL